MAVIGTFGSFTAARLGIYASQSSLNVTGNNIANINTVGYTRQRMDLVSLYSPTYARYANSYQQNIGYGVLTSSVSQLRDPFLDIRFREENASSGAYEAKLDCLQQLSNILDEVGKGTNDFGIIAAQLEDFLGQLQNLNNRTGVVVNDSTVRGSAQTLARLFNNYSKAMETLAANKLGELKENVKTVNSLLTQIRDLNVQIRDAGIVGDPALELRDARNLCIDQLSAYMKIDVRYDEEKIDEFNSVERINISIADSGSPPIKLIEGIYGAQLSMPDKIAEKNLEHDPKTAKSSEFVSKIYLDADGNLQIEYTSEAKKALKDDGSGELVRNSLDAVGALIEKLKKMEDDEITAAQEMYQRIGELADETVRLTNNQTTLNNEITTLNADIAALDSVIEGLEEKLEGKTEEDPDYAELQKELADTQKDLADKQKELADKQKELAGVEADLKQNGEDIEANNQAIAAFEKKFGITPSATAYSDEIEQKIKDHYAALVADLENNSADGLLNGEPYFDPATANAPYIRADGSGTTWNVDEAKQIPNAVEGSYENLMTMFVEPLRDVKGRYLRDQNHKEIRDPVELSDTQLYGSLQAIREFLTEKGEFSSDDDLIRDREAAQKRGLPYYQKALDALARKFAETFNQANQLNFSDVKDAYLSGEGDNPYNMGLTYGFLDSKNNVIMGVDENGNEIELTPGYFDDLDQAQKDLAELKDRAAKRQLQEGDTDKIQELEKKIETGYKNLETLREQGQLTDLWGFYNGGVLFSNSGDNNDGSGITAGNITVSKDWITGDVRILNTKVADGLDHSTANDNILHMIALMSQDMNYFPNEIVGGAMDGGARLYFSGSFAERLADMNGILSVETNITGLLYNEYTATTLSLENSRQSVAGVDLNDEATNMMVFQKSYAAACQLMTTLDSMLDKLINGTLR